MAHGAKAKVGQQKTCHSHRYRDQDHGHRYRDQDREDREGCEEVEDKKGYEDVPTRPRQSGLASCRVAAEVDEIHGCSSSSRYVGR